MYGFARIFGHAVPYMGHIVKVCFKDVGLLAVSVASLMWRLCSGVDNEPHAKTKNHDLWVV